MKAYGRYLLFFSIPSILLAGALATLEMQVLEVVNTDRPARLLIRLEKPPRFEVAYVHSIYLQPAAEEFEVEEGGEIILRGVRTRSPSVAHYYGFEEDNRGYFPVKRKMKSFALRLGMTRAQTLTHGGKTISLDLLGERGDRVEIRTTRMTWGGYLLSRFGKERG